MSARVRSWLATQALCSALAWGCAGTELDPALDEPLFVRSNAATFHRGPLPGLPPDTMDAPEGLARITSLELSGGIVTTGQVQKALAGRASTTAASVALAWRDGAGGFSGSGYWVVPVEGPDALAEGELTWRASFDVGSAATLGARVLAVVAIDEEGRAGVQRDVRLCVLPDYPEGLHACDATLAPPDTIVSLSWAGPADLDLVVVTPAGKAITGKRPTAIAHGGTIPRSEIGDPHVGVLTRDANAGCHRDLLGRESVVWQDSPADGAYLVYASLFSTCGETTVAATLTVYRRGVFADGTYGLAVDESKSLILNGISADGGATRGTYLTSVALR